MAEIDLSGYGVKTEDSPDFSGMGEATPKISNLRGIFNSATDFLAFEWGDELTGLDQAIIDYSKSLFTGEEYDFDRSYDKGLAKWNNTQGAWEKEHPKLNLTGKGIALGTSMYGAGKFAATKVGQYAAKNLPRVAKYGGSGAIAGGLGGSGASEEGQKTVGATLGAAIGAPLGLAIPGLMYGAGKLADATVKPLWRFFTQTPKSQAIKEIQKAMQRDMLDPQQLQIALDKLGPGATLADAGGEGMLRQLETLAQTPGPAANIIKKFLTERMAGQHGRVKSMLARYLGVGDDGFYSALEQLGARLKTKAAPYYEASWPKPVNQNQTMMEIMESPIGKKVLKRAQKIMQAKLKNLDDYFQFNDKGKMIGIKQDAPLEVWDYVKRGFDDEISKHMDEFGNLTKQPELGRGVMNLKKMILSELDNQVPEYAQARAIYANDAAGKQALKWGRKFLRQDAEFTDDMLVNMSSQEKEYFRIGAMRAVKDQIDNAVDYADAYKKIFNKQATRDKLRALFPDDETFDSFADYMQREASFARTRAVTQGGSPTSRREAGREDLGSVMTDLGQGRGLTGAMANIIRRSTGATDDELGQQMVNIYLNPLKNQNLQNLNKLQAVNPLHPPGNIGPSVIGSGAVGQYLLGN